MLQLSSDKLTCFFPLTIHGLSAQMVKKVEEKNLQTILSKLPAYRKPPWSCTEVPLSSQENECLFCGDTTADPN